MYAIANLIRQSPVIYALLSCLDNVLVIAGCAIITVALFHVPLRRKPVFYAVCAVLTIAYGLAAPSLPSEGEETAALVWSVVALALPFCCMALLFCGREMWKAMLTAAGYALVEGVRFIILLVFFDFDYNARDDALELAVGLLVDLAFFLLAYLLLTRYARRRAIHIDLTRNGAILFLLMVLSAAVFITSLLVLAPAYSRASHAEFAFMLLNIPVMSATVTFALVRFFRMRAESENYRRQLQMQIQQFEWMEQMVEDVRIFRHDFPKKMRPLIAYLDEDRPEEARQMAEQFSDFAAHTGERFHTGNYRLDTVLFCEQQIAQRDNIQIDVPFDTVFPAEGIDPDDIYTIFPNALDNAIEACRQVEGERVISFRSHRDSQTVFITIRNPMTGSVKMRNGLPQTGKTDKSAHGYGLRSLRKAAAKYGDDNVAFTAENGVFELRIFLRFADAAKPAESVVYT